MKLWRSRDLLFISCIALSRVSGAAEQIYVAGYKGREVQVPCPYEKGLEANEKYLCRNNCGDDHDVVIKTTQGKKDRYVIHDDIEKRVFTVTISDLYPTDAGKYWCGMSRLGPDPYSAEVNVEVVPVSARAPGAAKPLITVEPVNSQTTRLPKKPFKGAAPYHVVVPVVTLAVPIIIFVLVMVRRYKRNKGAGAHQDRRLF